MLCRLCLIMMVRSRIRNYHITDFYKNVYVLVFHYFSWICSFHNYLLTCTLPGDGKDTNVQWVTVRILVSSGLWVMGEIFFFSEVRVLEGRPLCTCFSRLYHFSSIRLLSGGYVALFSDMFFVHAGIMMFLSSRKTSDFISILSLIGKFCCSLGRKYVCFLSPCSSVGSSSISL